MLESLRIANIPPRKFVPKQIPTSRLGLDNISIGCNRAGWTVPGRGIYGGRTGPLQCYRGTVGETKVSPSRCSLESTKELTSGSTGAMQAHSSRNQVALITGGNGGIGSGIAVRLAEMGFYVVVNYFDQPETADAVLARIERVGGVGRAIQADVGDKKQLEKMFDEIAGLASPLYVLINNAAVQTWSSFSELKEEDWDRTIRTNLKGTFLCTQLGARQMMEHSKGVIINIGSGANRVPFPHLIDYSASKSGIDMLTRSAAREFGPRGIRVNCIAPGAIENERTQAEDPTYAETWAALTPLRRCGTIADIANSVAFLVSEQSSFITGQTLFVDGGLWARNEWPYDGQD